MDVIITPSKTGGILEIPSSKSVSHRKLICAALSEEQSTLRNLSMSDDVEATMNALSAIGASFEPLSLRAYKIYPILRGISGLSLQIDCRESGSTLRFLLPILAVLKKNAEIICSGRLPNRPLSPLYEELCAHGVLLSAQGKYPMTVGGSLDFGEYHLNGNVSSQYISGLMFALPLCAGNSHIVVSGPLESKSYIDLTMSVLAEYGIHIEEDEKGYFIAGGQKYCAPAESYVEADWSNAAFFLALGAIGKSPVTCRGLNEQSLQGDRRILELLSRFGAKIEHNEDAVTVYPSVLHGITVDASDIPDLVPILSVLGALSEGETRIINAQRLRYKESDRLQAMQTGLALLGADIVQTEDGLRINGKKALCGGCVDGFGDHRIVMSFAVAAQRASGNVRILGAEAHTKSYPDFFSDLRSVGADFYFE